MLPGRRCPGNPSFPQIGKANLLGYLPKKEMAVFFLTLNSGLAPNKAGNLEQMTKSAISKKGCLNL
jgi:hypothetical protein